MREYEAIVARIPGPRDNRLGVRLRPSFGSPAPDGIQVTRFDYRPEIEEAVVALEQLPPPPGARTRELRQIPFAGGSFDAVLSCGLIQHVEDPDASVKRLAACSSPAAPSSPHAAQP